MRAEPRLTANCRRRRRGSEIRKKDNMLLESALAELSIDILDDNQPQMLLHVTKPAVAAAESGYSSPALQIWESSNNPALESSSKPITRHEEKKECQNGRSTRGMMHLLEDQEKYNCYREPTFVPFGWEIHPGVPKLSQRESEIRDHEDEDQSSPVPLKFPPTASWAAAPLKFPPTASWVAATSAPPASPKNAGGCFNWNLSHLSPPPQSINVFKGSVQGANMNGYEGDDDEDIIPSKSELDSNEYWSPVSTLELPESPGSSSSIQPANSNSSASLTPSFEQPSGPARSAGTTLLWGVFPCIFLPSSKRKGKKKQPEWAIHGHQVEDSKVNSTCHIGPKMMENFQPVRPISALKKKSSRSGSSNRSFCESTAGLKQVRFSVETDACFSSSNGGRGETVPPPTQMDWASYGLF